ncbi:3'(2'),5'-bisphosphate nucleotidase CysQ [Nitrospira lenta]|uniref:Putative Inositol-phosphate phosphatase n=1 Tax=Nitrospira lenta TaxID=1436998 RepID=A0A330L484_9BACT|nr:3'(2'),5'-bisphosphate nucleotidase CysQ [Nitrospira lenta]SPP64591.1 putative Inositol-phosphate phosphatase [Nitrospira lenta]
MAWEQEYRVLTTAIRDAGDAALRLAADGFQIYTKPDDSPVTSADHAVNDILMDRLLGHFPHDGWLSEETPDTAVRLTKPRVWVIDPIDGTKAFIRHEPEYCISVALLEGTQPVLAAIFNPSTNELYTAIRGQGLHLNGAPAPHHESKTDQLPTIALSPWELHVGRFRSIESQMVSRPMRSIAWALALAARGTIHGVITFEPENEWDVAAGMLLLEEAGGSAHDGAGQPLHYNQPRPRFEGFIATVQGFPDRLITQVRQLPRSAH